MQSSPKSVSDGRQGLEHASIRASTEFLLRETGCDPREEFDAPKFREDVNSLEDLQEGMQLEGVVTNVTAFGAFVDVGVHQDGLVHVSQLADRFVKDPKDVVKVGDTVAAPPYPFASPATLRPRNNASRRRGRTW